MLVVVSSRLTAPRRSLSPLLSDAAPRVPSSSEAITDTTAGTISRATGAPSSGETATTSTCCANGASPISMASARRSPPPSVTSRCADWKPESVKLTV